jgi:serine/threonine protein kinase
LSALSLPIVAILGTLAAAALALYAAFHLLGLVFWLVGGAIVFAFQQVRDALQLVVRLVATFFALPRILIAVILGRWSAARHHGDAFELNLLRSFRLFYQLAIGNLWEVFVSRPRKQALEGKSTATAEGVVKAEKEPQMSHAKATRKKARAAYRAKREKLKEEKVLLKGETAARKAAKAKPSLHTPGPDKPKRGQGFDGYKVVGSLPSGGSGAKLYVADPTEDKRAALSRNGKQVAEQVVIKCFTLDEGSNLSQIVRESRALESAKQMGMVYEHGLDERRYFYVMPYVAGENLSRVSERMHAMAGDKGLGGKQIKQALSYVGDLLAALQQFHEGGLWHKDIKPDNVVIRNGRAHLVDLGLVTPLTSAMTLTTHGTEYFRDPELVRQALKGAKVQDVDGARFDLYGTGAVLYSLVEDSFPAHGSLSSVTKNCPDSVQWIIRRAMADLNSRYSSAAEMLADVRTVQAAADPFATKPAALPSMGGQAIEPDVMTPPPVPHEGTSTTPNPIPAAEIPVINAPGPTYKPGPVTAAYAADSVNQMPPPVPGAARMHALNAAQQARMAARSARQAAREARRKAQVHFSARKQELQRQRVDARQWGKKKSKRFAANPNRGALLGIGAAALIGILVAGVIQSERHKQEIWGHQMEMRARVEAQAEAVRRQGERVVEEANKITRPQAPVIQSTSYGTTSQVTHIVKNTPPTPAIPNFRSVHRETNPQAIESVEQALEVNVDRGQGYVLVLDEMSRHDQNASAKMKGLLQHLQDQDYGLLGVFENDFHHTSESEIELSAQARRSLGLYGPADQLAREQIKDFLADHGQIDAVLWCGKVGDNLVDSAYLFSQADFDSEEIFALLQGAE